MPRPLNTPYHAHAGYMAGHKFSFGCVVVPVGTRCHGLGHTGSKAVVEHDRGVSRVRSCARRRPVGRRFAPHLVPRRSDNVPFIVYTSGTDPFARAHALGAETLGAVAPPALPGAHTLLFFVSLNAAAKTVQREENGGVVFQCRCPISQHVRDHFACSVRNTRFAWRLWVHCLRLSSFPKYSPVITSAHTAHEGLSSSSLQHMQWWCKHSSWNTTSACDVYWWPQPKHRICSDAIALGILSCICRGTSCSATLTEGRMILAHGFGSEYAVDTYHGVFTVLGVANHCQHQKGWQTTPRDFHRLQQGRRSAPTQDTCNG
jgi:hypothetical protein